MLSPAPIPPLTLAHSAPAGAAPPSMQEILLMWSWEPAVIVTLFATALLYRRGIRRMWAGGRVGRGIKRWEAGAFWGGWLALLIAVVSPLHPLGQILFSAHMTQHEIMMLVAAPLLVLGRPLTAFLLALPLPWSRGLARIARVRPVRYTWRGITNPVVAWAIHAAALWIWHVPLLFEAVLASEAIHHLQHFSFLVSALLFWWALFHGRPGFMGYGAATLYVFTTMIHSGLLGALITYADSVLYPTYQRTTPLWGQTPLEDQQLGGLIMWIPAALAYIVAGLAMMAGWMRESERSVLKTESSGGQKVALLTTLLLLCGCNGDANRRAAALTGGEPAGGKLAIQRLGCAACHTISGIPGANGLVGPPLDGVAHRIYIGGVLTNTPENMIRWLQNPQAVDHLTAMPNLNISEAEARDIAAYLYSLR